MRVCANKSPAEDLWGLSGAKVVTKRTFGHFDYAPTPR